jgi:hypothetical protein
LGWASHEDEINDAVRSALEDEGYIYTEDNGSIDRNDMYHIDFGPGYNDSSDQYGFQDFASRLASAEDNFDAIMNNVRERLEEEGIIKPSSEIVTKALNGLDKIRGTIVPRRKPHQGHVEATQ